MPAGVSAEVKTYKLYVNGDWLEGDSRKTFPVYDPSTEEVIAQVPDGNSKDVDRAVAAAKAAFEEKIKTYQAIASDQADKKKIQQADADKADKTYNELNFHDDQFDLSDAMLALAISLLAVTALTQKRWLFVLAMIPTVFGVVMGLAGLLGWRLHPDYSSIPWLRHAGRACPRGLAPKRRNKAIAPYGLRSMRATNSA